MSIFAIEIDLNADIDANIITIMQNYQLYSDVLKPLPQPRNNGRILQLSIRLFQADC
jgi:hypothetical protein